MSASDGRIITRHILPNVMSDVIVADTLGIPTIVLLESFLGFLGFAVKPPLISWGLMLEDAGMFSVIGSYPWILSPVGSVLLTVFAFNALGDGLRDAIDPYFGGASMDASPLPDVLMNALRCMLDHASDNDRIEPFCDVR